MPSTCLKLLLTLLMVFSVAPRQGVGQEAPGGSIRLKPAPNGRVAIPLEAFGKEFLLSVSAIPQFQAPTSRGLTGRIVTFELFADGVDLYESTTGQVVTDELPSRRLLASFPVAKREKTQIQIDFNAGMRRVITSGWYGDSSFSPSGLVDVLEVPQSRVFLVKEHEERLEIRQAVQARSRATDQDVEQRLEIRYFISPYTKPEFEAKENTTTASRYVRFFQGPAELELTSGRPISRIARFDITKPVTFYYSANTPEEFVDAVRDGVLYWNRAFGKDVVRCEKAPEGVTAPSPDHNMVQWVPWDSAGFAYADVLIDPRTGRSLHGQAYMTSVFGISGVQRARLVLRRLRAMEGKKEEKKDEDDKKGEGDKSLAGLLGLPLFRTVASCECDIAEYAGQMAEGIEALLGEAEAGDKQLLQASQDYVRNVVAHEVGHVLGLRHNFAGSLASTLSPQELDEWFHKYLTAEQPPSTKEGLTTNSVMEYSHFQAAVYSGCRMRTTEEVLPHDKAAIRWGYFGEPAVVDEKLLFGTDDDVGTYGDLHRFDYGAEPLVAALSEMGTALNTLPVDLIERFIAAKAPRDARDAVPLESVDLDAGSSVASFLSDYRDAFRWFDKDVRSLRLEREFAFVGALNEEERQAAHWKSLLEQVEKVGGVQRLGFAFLPLNLTLDLGKPVQGAVGPEKFDATKLTEKVGELLETPQYKSFVGADGQSHSFTDEEKALIKRRAEAFFRDFEKQLVQRIFQTWATLPRDLGVAVQGHAADDDIVSQFETQIIAAAKAVILARDEKDESKRIRGKVDKSLVEVVGFRYDLETRLEAARALADRAGAYPAWSKDARGDIHKELKSLVEAALNIQNFKEFSDKQLSRALRDWYLDQQRILGELPH